MGLEGRSQQHPSDQAVCAIPIGHRRFSASQYRCADNVGPLSGVVADHFACTAALRAIGLPEVGHGRSRYNIFRRENLTRAAARRALRFRLRVGHVSFPSIEKPR